MDYKAKHQQDFLLAGVVLMIMVLTSGWENIWIRVFGLIVLIKAALSLCTKYLFTIEEDKLIYKIFLFNINIYEKKTKKSNIKRIIFKRAGWKTKLAVIKLEKGFPIRIALFTPTTIFEDLLTFCDKNDIQVEKTKDYRILENMA
ncbi:hypothetical protein C7437_11141 [Psychrobacillus insolitus]|uniref:PH (Pleckstrin Homology) domain-containing protein n=1 Tax=Psychrobacillus insolitus TaxID=1461 RepID=A0A2W7MBF0_9BACI|nr:diguanylate cyclase [Psychrobacillus insolitus]PZX02449.1 hypothetical protein C7437_11141 [Psychrobacillus insolitus]